MIFLVNVITLIWKFHMSLGAAICKESDIPENNMRCFKTDHGKVVVYRLSDGFYATQAKCSHLLGSLHKGKIIDGCKIQCPLHRAQFDIKSGEVEKWANFPVGVQLLNFIRSKKALKTYTVHIVGSELFIEA